MMMREQITLRKAMKMLDKHEPWTVSTENGHGWIFYFDGETLHDGSKYGLTLNELLDRECVESYEREERKYWCESERKYHHYMELEAGMAFIVKGSESGTI